MVCACGVGNFFFSNLGGVELFFTILGNSGEFLGIPKGIPRISKGFPRNSHLGFSKFQQTINQTLFMNYCVFLMYNFFHLYVYALKEAITAEISYLLCAFNPLNEIKNPPSSFSKNVRINEHFFCHTYLLKFHEIFLNKNHWSFENKLFEPTVFN